MSRASLRTAISAVLLLTGFSTVGSADPIGPGTTYVNATAIQDITILGQTVLNPGDAFTFTISGDGYLKFNRDAQVGSSITISSAEGLFTGFHPVLGDFVFGSIHPLTPNDFHGLITNIVQDPVTSALTSGHMTFGGASFGLMSSTLGFPLYTDPDQGFEFEMELDGLPPSPGKVFTNSGDDVLNIYFMGELVATSSNRRIVVTAVPEPASLAMLGLGGLTLAGRAWKRRRSVTASR